jgi:Undecaprenyl-phosphate glucose phosphotransferase
MPSPALPCKLTYIDEEVVQRICKLADCAALFAITLIATTLASPASLAPAQAGILGIFALLLAFLNLVMIRNGGLYRPAALARGPSTFLKTAAIVVVFGFSLFSFLQWQLLPMKVDLYLWWSSSTVGYLAVSRLMIQFWAAPRFDAGRFRRRIAIVGGGTIAEDAVKTLINSKGLDVEIVGMFDDRYDDRSPPHASQPVKIGRIADLAAFARGSRIDLIIVAIPMSAETRLLGILKRLWELPVDIRISGRASALQLGAKAYTKLGDLPLLPVFDRPLNGWGLFTKNVVERVLAAFGLIVLAPVMLGVALAVKLESKGRIIFKQRRYGFNNELIEVFKFRSMYTDLSDANAAKLVTKGDPRVTRVGRIIRKTSLDELPQLFNVLTGQLSLVGPRPHATEAKAADTLYEQVVDGYFARHKVRPGITGWAQINGWRGETDTREKIEQRVKYDLEYIDRWSLLFDLSIVMKTPFALLKSENAY